MLITHTRGLITITPLLTTHEPPNLVLSGLQLGTVWLESAD